MAPKSDWTMNQSPGHGLFTYYDSDTSTWCAHEKKHAPQRQVKSSQVNCHYTDAWRIHKFHGQWQSCRPGFGLTVESRKSRAKHEWTPGNVPYIEMSEDTLTLSSQVKQTVEESNLHLSVRLKIKAALQVPGAHYLLMTQPHAGITLLVKVKSQESRATNSTMTMTWLGLGRIRVNSRALDCRIVGLSNFSIPLAIPKLFHPDPEHSHAKTRNSYRS